MPLVTRLEADAEGRAIVYVEGEIDVATSATFREALIEALEKSATIVVDVGAVEFIDSSGMKELVSGHRGAEQAGGSLRLRRPSPMLQRLLEITALDSVLLIDNEGLHTPPLT